MEEWREDWLSLGTPGVPMLVRPDGPISRGLDALRQFAGLIPE